MKASEKNVEKIKGKPKSGRIWKPEHKKFSKLTIQSSNRTSWGKKMAIKNEKKLLQDREKQIKEELKQNKIALMERQKLNEKRRLENERKSEIVQVVSDPRKIKKLRKKQLRQYEKRDIDKLKKV